jgi:hypothetical protein
VKVPLNVTTNPTTTQIKDVTNIIIVFISEEIQQLSVTILNTQKTIK